MTCPHCGKPIPRRSSASKKRWRKAAVTVLLLAAAVTAAWLLWPTPSKADIVGTWRMDMPVGKAMTYLSEVMDEDHTLVGDLLDVLDEEQTVTVYCRFFEDDTYHVYADTDEVIAVVDQALDAAIAYMCDEGLDKLIESGELSATTTALLQMVVNTSSDEIASLLGEAVDKVTPTLYNTLREEMTPPTDTGDYRYVYENKRIYMGLKKDAAVEDGVYLIWQYDGEQLYMSSDTFFG